MKVVFKVQSDKSEEVKATKSGRMYTRRIITGRPVDSERVRTPIDIVPSNESLPVCNDGDVIVVDVVDIVPGFVTCQLRGEVTVLQSITQP